jgi:eukaryotic-like serine/threonine-protein kinase
MGEVYRARDERLGRDVAVKILAASYASDADRLRRFDQEARAAAALNHPNILAVYDIGTHDGGPYIVSELLDGQTLRDVLGHGPLPARKAIEYGIALAAGLGAAHDRGIVHRDIKPQNVFITADGRVKILDFGLAKLRDPLPGARDATGTVTTADSTGDVILGTAGYMSPEQVRGQPADARSDIFSFGAVLYEMVCGQRAFAGDSAIETLSAILKHDPPLHSTPTVTIPPALASIIQHCLEKDREQRFQSARDLAFALSRLTNPSASDAAKAPVIRTRRAKRGIAGAALAGVVLAAGGAAYLRRAPVSRPEPTFQPVTFRRGHVDAARFASDGQPVIASATWGGQPLELTSTRLDTMQSTPLPNPGELLRSVSQTGELAVIVKENVLARVPMGGGGIRELLPETFDADWAPDESLAVIRLRARRQWVEYPIGKVLYESKNGLNTLRVSPDGALVAVMEQQELGGGPEWLTIVGRSGSRVSSRKFGGTPDDALAWTRDGREVWFTASEAGGRAAIHAMTRDGRERVVHRAMGSVRIFDLASDGRALLSSDTVRADISVVDVKLGSEQDLTWGDWSRPTALSDDGQILSFADLGRTNMTGDARGYIRRTDGSPAVLLSEAGNTWAFSPDGQWVLAGRPGGRAMTLVPTGAGQVRTLDPGRVSAFTGLPNGRRWMPDGRRIVFAGNEANRPRRVFIQSVAGGPPEALTPEGAAGPLIVAPDSTVIIVNNEKGHFDEVPSCRRHAHSRRRGAASRRTAHVEQGGRIHLGARSHDAPRQHLSDRAAKRTANALARGPVPRSGRYRLRKSARRHVGRRQQVRLRLPEKVVRALRRDRPSLNLLRVGGDPAVGDTEDERFGRELNPIGVA